jgi:hypothetical protein
MPRVEPPLSVYLKIHMSFVSEVMSIRYLEIIRIESMFLISRSASFGERVPDCLEIRGLELKERCHIGEVR